MVVGQGTDPDSARIEGYVVPCLRCAHLVDPWVAPAAICRSSDEILCHHVQGGRHKHWSPDAIKVVALECHFEQVYRPIICYSASPQNLM